MTYSQGVKKGTDTLIEHDVPDAAYDAQILMEHVTGMDRTRFLAEQGSEMSPEHEEAFFELIKKRADRIPLQHLTHVQMFMGLPIYVDERVLCPRLDTETLAMEVYDIIDMIYRQGGLFPPPDNVLPLRHDIYYERKLSLLDLCTGSGCVAISAADHARERGFNLDITAVDASAEALEVAKKNDSDLKTGIRFLQGDLYEPVAGERFHVITANPPYIPSKIVDGLMPEVRDHEPRMALDGGEDGLIYYRRITEEALEHLEPGGYLLYEIGFDQGPDVYNIMTAAGFSEVRVIKDLAGDDRVVRGHL